MSDKQLQHLPQQQQQKSIYPTIQELKDNYGIDLVPQYYAFLIEYVSNGYNASQAYRSIKPHCKYTTCLVEGPQLLVKPTVKSGLQVLLNCNSALTTRKEDVTRDMLRIQQRAEQKDQLNVALNAVVERAKLHKLYDNEESDEKRYVKFLSAIQINVRVGDNHQNHGQDEAKTIDVVPLLAEDENTEAKVNENNEL